MTERGPVDLIHLVDEENSVVVRVAGPAFAVSPWDGCLEVDIVVTSEFAKGHLAGVCLLPRIWMIGQRRSNCSPLANRRTGWTTVGTRRSGSRRRGRILPR